MVRLNFGKTARMFSLLLFCLFGSVLYLSAQQSEKTLHGIVQDAKGNLIGGATVREVGGTATTSTDDKGNYTLRVSSKAIKLEISHVGFKTIVIDAKDEAVLYLNDSNSALDDVVVVGYQTVSRRKNTAAVSTISGKEIENLPAASFDQLLQGRLSGVNVQNYSGEPGASPTVAVRGNSKIGTTYDQFNAVSSPLYVVDGVPQPTESYTSSDVGTGTNYLGGVNPNDIESIDVLKDAAAAAIYGSRGANGVILIKTKKGVTGEPRINMDGYVGITQRPELRDVDLGTAERRAKMALLSQSLTYANQRNLPLMLTDSLNPAYNGNTDYQGMYYRTGIITNTDLGMSGGANNTTYRFNANYYDEQGVVKATGFKRYSMRLNLMSKALKGKITFNPLIAFSRMDRDRGTGSSTNPISLAAGSMPSSLFNLSEDKQAYLLGAYDANLDKNTNNQFTFNLNIGVNFNSFLKFTSQTAYLYNTSRRDWSRTNVLNSGSGNSSSSFADNESNVSTSNYLTFTKIYGKHNINLIGGQDVLYDVYQRTNVYGYGGVSDAIQTVTGYNQSKILTSSDGSLSGYSDYQSYGILSYYSRLAYDYDGKYLLSASFRSDGSSRFGKDSKWGTFPSVSLGWLISEEDFFKNWGKSITLLKVRGSVGNTGSLSSVGNYQQYNLYSVNAGGYEGNYSATSYNGVTSVMPNFSSGVAQPELSWERSTQMNLGVDAEIQNGKYTMSVDLWNKDNKDQMFSINLPVTTGYSTALTNAIGVRNTGLDFTFAANQLSESSPLKWFSRLNVSYSKSKIMYLPNGGRDILVNAAYTQWYKSHILSVGAPVNAFYLYKTLGVFASDADVPVNPLTGDKLSVGTSPFEAGEFHLADLDGDYKIDPFVDGINPDKMPIGDPNPKFTGGWTNNFTYKSWTLGLFFTYTFGRDVLDLYKGNLFNTFSGWGGNAVSGLAQYALPALGAYNIWTKDGDQAEYAKLDLGTYRYYYRQDQTFFLTKGDYVRLKSLSLSYNFPAPKLQKMGIQKFRLFAVIDNLLRWQRSKDLPDAEAVNAYGEYDGNGYPIPKKMTFGLEINF